MRIAEGSQPQNLQHIRVEASGCPTRRFCERVLGFLVFTVDCQLSASSLGAPSSFFEGGSWVPLVSASPSPPNPPHVTPHGPVAQRESSNSAPFSFFPSAPLFPRPVQPTPRDPHHGLSSAFPLIRIGKESLRENSCFSGGARLRSCRNFRKNNRLSPLTAVFVVLMQTPVSQDRSALTERCALPWRTACPSRFRPPYSLRSPATPAGITSTALLPSPRSSPSLSSYFKSWLFFSGPHPPPSPAISRCSIRVRL